MRISQIAFLASLCAAIFAGCASPPPPKAPDPADLLGTANYLRGRVYSGDIGAFYRSLPESYRQNIRMLGSVAARSMDDDMWLAFQGLWMDVALLLDKQSGRIADFLSDEPLPYPTREQFLVIRAYDVRQLGRSLSKTVRQLDRADLREGKIESFLDCEGVQETVSLIMRLGKQSGRWMEPLRLAEDTAPETLNMVYWVGEQPVTNRVEWTNVEGRWVPQTVAVAWPFVAGDALSRLEALPKSDQDRAKFLLHIWALRKQIRLMSKAGSQEEFEAVLLPFLRTWL
ncbi:MAG: hypothetical protein ACI4QT_00860 [Kiritimatiellia bacterium]